MIKVLEHGVMKEKCSNCRAKLQYSNEDVISEKRPGGMKYIVCPDCGSKIIIQKPTSKSQSDDLDIDL